MRVLVSGANGFLGSHVIRLLVSKGIETVALTRTPWLGTVSGVSYIAAPDLGDAAAIKTLLEDSEPTHILHLAGTATGDATAMYRANTIYACSLLDASSRLATKPRLLLVGSAAEYGPIAESMTLVSEDHPCQPESSYGISKLAQTMHALAYRRELDVVIARPFNLMGPGMPEHLAMGRFAQQIAKIGRRGGVLRTRSLHSERDFVAVQDVADALLRLMTHSHRSGEIINICTGVSTHLRDVVETLIRVSGFPIALAEDAAGEDRYRRVIGNPAKLQNQGIRLLPPNMEHALREILRPALDNEAAQ